MKSKTDIIDISREIKTKSDYFLKLAQDNHSGKGLPPMRERRNT